MIIRRETANDAEAIRSVTAAAFRGAEHSAPPTSPGGPPGEVDLIEQLRSDEGWVPELSLVAELDGRVVGHVVGTRASVDGEPAIGLGPLSVEPELQGSGVGAALMHSVLGAADALAIPLVGLLGDPDYYGRFGFVPASTVGVDSPDPEWGSFFQVRQMSTYSGQRGLFTYAAPFNAV